MKKTLLHRRESLILTAIDIINELGIQGLSIREVAKRQGISAASLFGHFKSKNELIHAVLDHFTLYDNVIMQSIELKSLHSKKAIVYYIDSFYTYYENYPAITAILLAYDTLRCEPDFSERMKDILLLRSSSLIKMITEAQNTGEIRSDIGAESIADMILGSCAVICLKWRTEKYKFPLKSRVLNTLDAILDSFTPK
ncbi:MAG TPA: TetR/AcrR family transcriptional regulator [Clostridia bacterium]